MQIVLLAITETRNSILHQETVLQRSVCFSFSENPIKKEILQTIFKGDAICQVFYLALEK
jgi:hypothetical protein